MDDYETFTLDGAELRIPRASLSDGLRERLEDGRYEERERELAQRLLKPGDRVLDLGSGAGMTAIIAARVVGSSNVFSIDANPEMRTALEYNLRNECARGLTLIEAAVVPDSFKGDVATMNLRGAFWAAALDQGSVGKPRGVEVAVRRFSDLLSETMPSAVMMDIEGAEVSLLTAALPDHIRLLIVELHPRVYGTIARDHIVASLERQGFRNVSQKRERCSVFAFEREICAAS